MSDNLLIAGRAFQSRLIVGTGKYRSFQEMARAHAASGAEMVTVAVRRVNLSDKSKESLLDYIDREKIFILPNTAACYTAEEAIRTARLAREVGLSNWIKLEVIGDQQTLFPDTEQLAEATRVLVKEGFVVLPYTNDDLIAARKLIDAGAAAVMPLAAPIGSGLGVQNPREPENSPGTHYRGAHDCGCRRGSGVGRGDCHGTRRRRRVDEHRYRRSARPRADGRGHARCGHRRAQVLSSRPHAQAFVRFCLQPDERRGSLKRYQVAAWFQS